MTDHRQPAARPPHPPEPPVAGPTSLFGGVGEAVREVLGVASLRHRSALHAIGAREALPGGVVEAIYSAVAASYASRSPPIGAGSRETWRWFAPQPQIGAANRSPEVVLERAVVAAALRQERTDWSNQVPVASGVVGANSDRRCAIDLVHRLGEDAFAFIELKVASDTPLFAAVELISYGCAWLLARQEPPRESLTLLAAKRIQLVVLAPGAFYAPFRLGPLQALLAAEVAALGRRHGVELGFAFQVLDEAALAPRELDDAALLARFDTSRPL